MKFNTRYLTESVTNLPLAAHAPAPSLLDDGDIESHPGPPKVNAILQHYNARDRERDFQASRYQFSTPTYRERDHAYSEAVESEIGSD